MPKISAVIRGLQIIEKYAGPDAFAVDAQHDVIYAGPDADEAMTETDRDELVSLGWHYDKRQGSWACFT